MNIDDKLESARKLRDAIELFRDVMENELCLANDFIEDSPTQIEHVVAARQAAGVLQSLRTKFRDGVE